MDPVLEGFAEQLRPGFELPSAGQPVHDADIREVELGRRGEPPLAPPAIGGQPSPQQRVFQDSEIALGRGARHAALTGDVRDVDDLAVAQGRGVQEAREGGQVADEALRGDLLPEVVGHIGVEQTPGPARPVYPGQIAVVEHPAQVEVAAELAGRQAAQLQTDGAAAEQVRGPATHLARAGAAQREAEAPVLHEPVHLVEQGGHLLHLVYDDLARRVRRVRLYLLAQKLGVGRVSTELVALEQVDPAGVRVGLPEQGRLPRLAGTPQEERLGSRRGHFEEPVGDHGASLYHAILNRNLKISCNLKAVLPIGTTAGRAGCQAAGKPGSRSRSRPWPARGEGRCPGAASPQR